MERKLEFECPQNNPLNVILEEKLDKIQKELVGTRWFMFKNRTIQKNKDGEEVITVSLKILVLAAG